MIATMWQSIPLRRYVASKLKAEHFQDLDAYRVFISLQRGVPVPALPFTANTFGREDLEAAIAALRRAFYHRSMAAWGERVKSAASRHDDRALQELLSTAPNPAAESIHISIEQSTIDLLGELMAESRTTVRPRSPGLAPLNLLFYPNSIYLIAGKPGDGKSALAEQILLDLSSQGTFCLDISLELNGPLRTQRYHQHIGGDRFSPRAYAESTWDPDRIQDVFDDVSYLQDAEGNPGLPRRLTLDARSTSLPDILASIRLWLHDVRETQAQLTAMGIDSVVGPPVVLVDFMQIVTLPGESNSYNVLSEVAQQLYALAKEEDISIIWISQFRKDSKDRDPAQPPGADDLEGSERLRQLAHHILLLSRPYAGWTSNDWRKIVIDAPKVRTGTPYTLEAAYNGKSLEFNADPLFLSSLPKTKPTFKR